MVLVTTSRRPSRRARILGRELAAVLPGSVYIPRGVKALRRMMELAQELRQRKVVVISSGGSEPRVIDFLVDEGGWRWGEVRIWIKKVNLQRELGKRVRAPVKGLISLGKPEVGTSLASLFELPILEKPVGDTMLADEKSIRFVSGGEEVGPVIDVERIEGAPSGGEEGG